MIYILDNKSKKLKEAEIVPANKIKCPLKKDGWNFNWKKLIQEQNCKIYFLKLVESSQGVEGALQLRMVEGMLIMNVLEIAPHNIGRNNKKYDYVAGCLIAFACRESFKLESEYKGFLTFVSKSSLIQWYANKYGAIVTLGQRMYISDITGIKLIKEYLERKEDKA